jgi:aminobenzoyl-glutamate transport protein
MSSTNTPEPNNNAPKTVFTRMLDFIEWAGNKLPDPAVLFVIALGLTWLMSAALAGDFADTNPKIVSEKKKETNKIVDEMSIATVGLMPSPLGAGALNTVAATAVFVPKEPTNIQVKSQLTGEAILTFLERMVKTFTGFHPLGVVLVAMLGVGVAEHTGFINACLKALIGITPKQFLTPMLLFVAIISHTAGDTGYVLVIPLGGIIFATAGRHPVAGIVCAFAGVSGGFSANVLVSPLDTLLRGITLEGAQVIEAGRDVNVLCNYIFMASSSILIILVGWYLTDYVIEPKLKGSPVDGDSEDNTSMGTLAPEERRGMLWGLASMVVCLAILFTVAIRGGQPILNRLIGDAIVPLIFLIFLIPGTVHGYVAKTVKSHRDIIKGMSKSMSTMGYYLVMAFFAALFIYAFNESNLGILLAVKGATFLRSLGLPPPVTILGIIMLTSFVNLLIGSASAKWALLGPIFVPMLMQLGFSPEFTQAAYRIGDSSTNIITPLMPYFPLIVVYAQRYVKSTGIGTLIALMLPYAICFLITWTVLLLVFWGLGLPLGFPLDAGFEYVPGY